MISQLFGLKTWQETFYHNVDFVQCGISRHTCNFDLPLSNNNNQPERPLLGRTCRTEVLPHDTAPFQGRRYQ